MNLTYQLLDHTADLRVRIIGESKAELFQNAGLTLADLICDPDTLASTQTVSIDVIGDDPADLMVNFLRELLYLWTGKEKLVKMVSILDVSDTALTASIAVANYDSQNHTILNEIKAVTYHQIAVEPIEDGWQATVVFDI
ncbi:protein archease [Desulfosarcina widdelii]|uniref:Protein archease n=1 Tax=Desulfosarcina widdelii TaxID=947919 RepID=A0A5K7Z218_9BACT|nr:archease [Desulfosarcina widdelii]BBO75726.1 protein archease [Desulfosarcina widdelii]